MNNKDTILNRLSDLTDFISSALERLESGEVLSLSHLDGEVEAVCEQAMSLPRDQIAEVQEPMAAMITKLEALGVALQDFQTHLKTEYDLEG